MERPVSVVKEMVENSLDAKSTKVKVEIGNGGRTYIKITAAVFPKTNWNWRLPVMPHLKFLQLMILILLEVSDSGVRRLLQ